MIKSEYIIEPDINKYSYAEKIKKVGLRKFIEEQLFWLDCTKLTDNGKYRRNQTINIDYKLTLGKCIFALKLCSDDESARELYEQIENIHRTNLEYEKENPPIVYETDKVKRVKRTSVKDKSTESTTSKKTRTETIADRKDKIVKSFKFVANG